MATRTNDNLTYTNPRVLIKLLEQTRKDVGAAIFNRKYKALREGWIAATYAKGISKATGILIYLRPNPRDELPDYFGFRAVPGKDFNTGENFEFEVFEYGDFSKEDFITALKKKILKYNAPNTIFICYVHKSLQNVNFKQLSEEIISSDPDIAELCLVVRFKGEMGTKLIKLFPEIGVLYVPNSFSKLFYPKYDFAKKIKALHNSDAGVVKINSEMQITEVKNYD